MDIDFSKVLRENMRDIMRQKGFTQQWLSVQTDIPDATISRYLAGVHNPQIEYVARMASAMGVSVDYMLGLSTSSVPDQPPSPEIRTLIAGYERADAHTKKMIWMQLDLVLTDEEKALAPRQSNEQKSEAV